MLDRIRFFSTMLPTIVLMTMCTAVNAQDIADPSSDGGSDTSDEVTDPIISEVPEKVSVEAVAQDEDIELRLERILSATGWFKNSAVRVDEGVVFLTGTTAESEHRQWATKLAGATEDVVAVVNRIEVTEPPLWNITPAIEVLRNLARDAIQMLPLFAIALVILLLTWLATVFTLKIADATLLRRIDNKLLREVARKAMAIPVIVIGIYLVLMVSGLSRLAVTVIGGTGLIGLVIGIAFRDIMENFLSSILISMQNPFKYADLIEVDGHKGYVHRVNTRGTLLMTIDGNHILIPNSTIYKNVIKNYTSNPNVRFDFVVGIGYDSAVSNAQEVVMDVLRTHPAVLDDPEPMVLVEELGSSTVNLRVCFWVNGREHSGAKVKSSVIRQALRKLEAAEISMPDDARELVFPSAVPIRMLGEESVADGQDPADADGSKKKSVDSDEEQISNSAEGDFGSEASEIHEQARRSRDPEEDETDLLGASDEDTNEADEKTLAAASA